MVKRAQRTMFVDSRLTLQPKESSNGFTLQTRINSPFRTPMAIRKDSISDIASKLSSNFEPRNGNVPFMVTGPRFTKYGEQCKCNKMHYLKLWIDYKAYATPSGPDYN